MSTAWRRRQERQESQPRISENLIPDGTVNNRQRPSAPEWAAVPPETGPDLTALPGATERSRFRPQYELHVH